MDGVVFDVDYMNDYMIYSINLHNCFDTIDYQQLKELIEDGFQKSLSDDYKHKISPDYILIVNSGDYYIGAAIVEQFKPGIYYLDKFVVRKEFQGEGIGRQLWQHILKKSSCLFWRAKVENGIINFYENNSDISISKDNWLVFFRNINKLILSDCFQYAVQKQETMLIPVVFSNC